MSDVTLTKEEAVREQILAAGRRLFQQFGLRKTTMEDIARAAGKGKSSLYYYFKSKEELFDAALTHEMQTLLAEVAQAVAQQTTTENKLYTFCTAWLGGLRQRAALNTLIAHEVLGDARLVRAIQQRFYQQKYDLLRQVLSFDATLTLSDATLDSLIFIILSGLYGLEQELLFEPPTESLQATLRLLAKAIVQTLRNQGD